MPAAMFPAGSRRVLSLEPGARYNNTTLQRQRIIDALRRAGPTGLTAAELQGCCNAPCVTKRVSELRRRSWPIDSHPQAIAADDGSVNTVARYVLQDVDPTAQGDLFDAEQ